MYEQALSIRERVLAPITDVAYTLRGFAGLLAERG